MSHRVVVVQTNYIPWKGYFDLLSCADTVVFLDSVQSTKNDWRNRNQIKTQAGKAWLTIPIRHSNELRIREVTVGHANWHDKHARTLVQSYARAPHAPELLPEIMAWYAEAGSYVHLSEINRVFLRHIARHLEITPTFVDVESILSDDEHDALGPTERLVEICRRLGATSYLSGPAAKQYVDQALFDAASIAVEWFNYEGYPVYPQLHGSFEHAVSVLDPLLMLGPQARAAIVRNNGYAISTGHDPLVPADA